MTPSQIENLILRLKVNYGQFIKLEKMDLDITCGGKSGIIVSETMNIQGTFRSGDVAGKSKFASRRYCRKSKMPGFVSSDVQFEVVVNYAAGDRFRIGYRSVANSAGTKIPRTKPKLTTRAPRITQMESWEDG